MGKLLLSSLLISALALAPGLRAFAQSMPGPVVTPPPPPVKKKKKGINNMLLIGGGLVAAIGLLALINQSNQTVHDLTPGDSFLPENCETNVTPDYASYRRSPARQAMDRVQEFITPGTGRMTVGGVNKEGYTFWDGCDPNSKIRGGYGSNDPSKCSQKLLINGAFAQAIDRHLLNCAKEGAKRAGLPEPTSLFINHMGCYNNRTVRGGTATSMHAHGRALDIGAINLIDAQGKVTNVSMHINQYNGRDGKNGEFYDGLRACWAKAVGTCRGSNGSIAHPKSKVGLGRDGNKRLHDDHLHLEYKQCHG